MLDFQGETLDYDLPVSLPKADMQSKEAIDIYQLIIHAFTEAGYEYEYNEEGKRKSAITKKLIGEEFVVINKVFYTYETDEESGNTIRTRELTVYDGKGNIISKDIHKETTSELTDSYEEEKMFFDITKD